MLLDARGEPMKFKAPPPPPPVSTPLVGNTFGQWANHDSAYVTMPGGAVMQFDLSRLTLADYRAMRTNYQLGASLNVLTFVMHQIDWSIECESAEIQALIEEDLRDNWTPLVRALSQSFWAGYSPIAVNYKNSKDGYIRIDKFKDLVPEECRINWKEIEGWAPPGKPTPKLYEFNGMYQNGIEIPVENCVHPDTPILCADFQWRRAGEIPVGAQILAFDEDDAHVPGGKAGRCYRTAEIVANFPGTKPSVMISTDRAAITASVDHPFLVRRRATKTGAQRDQRTGRMLKTNPDGVYVDRWEWRDARDLKPGDEVAWYGSPWSDATPADLAWLGGILDGEGHLAPNGTIGVSQRPGSVLDRIKKVLDGNGFDFDERDNKGCMEIRLRGGIRESLRLVALTRPVRFAERLLARLDGTSIKIGKSVDLATVESVTDVGDQPIASIQTSVGTFITGGFLSHNTLWYPLLMENGDHYGRKLLKPAFPSWYFSTLVHLFANRYFERFGEPVPIGRADFEDEVDMGGGNMVSGKKAMESILASIRNRAVVALPSDRDPTTKEYLYDIEYLESQMRGADFERYLGRLDEEMSLAVFTPVLLFRTADVGSYNLGQAHLRIFQQVLNAIAGDFQFYIQNYLVDRMRVLNFGEDSPVARWVFRRQGGGDVDMYKELMSALVNGGRAMPDLEELATIVGVKFNEIEQLTEPPAEPITDPNGDDVEQDPKAKPSTKARSSAPALSALDEGVARAAREYGKGKTCPTIGFRNRVAAELRRNGWPMDGEEIASNVYAKLNAWVADVAAADLPADKFANALRCVAHSELESALS